MVLPAPDNPNMLFAGGVNAGVWQTLDGGVTWKAIGDDLASLSIGAMTFDKTDPTKLWVGFGKQSSFRGISGAQTGVILFDTQTGVWSPPPSGYSGELMGKDISQIIANGNTIMVGVKTSPDESGIWYSNNGGASFTQAASLEHGNITSLVVDPKNPNRYYAAVANKGDPKGVYRTDDAGLNWVLLPDLPLSRPPASPAANGEYRVTYDIMLSIANDGTLVASVIDPIQTSKGLIENNPQVTVYRSTNQGATWTSMGTPSTTEVLPDGTTKQLGVYDGGQFNLHGALLVDPNDSTIVYISGDAQGPEELIGVGKPNSIGATVYSGRLFRGKLDASGQTVWEAITDGYTANNSGPHADSRFMMIDAAGNLLQTDDGGVYLRTDPQSRNGVWQSLNGNLQTGEVHTAVWNPLSHTVVTAMQDNGATMQIKAGDPTHINMSSGDGGVASVNPDWLVDGQRYAAVYTSSQSLSGLIRSRIDSENNRLSATSLELGIEKDGHFLNFGNAQGEAKPPRPRSPVYKSEALAAQTMPNVEAMTFYPAFKLNNIDPTRIAVGSYDLYIGQDSMQEDGEETVRIVAEKIFSTPENSGFTSLDYGARNNADALLAGTGFQDIVGGTTKGLLYYTHNVNNHTDPALVYESTGIQKALFDRELGTGTIYFSDGPNILRGYEDAQNNVEPYNIQNINGDLPAQFNERRGLDHIFKNGVSALVAAGTHNVAGGNWLYTLHAPAYATTIEWDKTLGQIPNAPVFGLDYSVNDDVLLAYTMGRGAFALYDVTTYFKEATQLIFGEASNDSQPINAQLSDGTLLDGTAFSRPLIKHGSGTLDLTNTTAFYSGGTQLDAGLTTVDANANLGVDNTGVNFNGGALRFMKAFNLDRSITLNAGGGTLDTNYLTIQQGNQAISGNGQLAITGGGQYTLTIDNSYSGGTLVNNATLASSKDAQLGNKQSGIRLDAGQLILLDGFILDESGTLNRHFTVDAGNGTLDTRNNDIAFSGSVGGTGTLNFLGRPLTIAGDININAIWNSPLNLPAGNTLRGTGQVNGALTVHGRLYPGNSPGTLTVTGPVTQMPGSIFAVDIDGTGTDAGAGNYSRLLVTGPNQAYTAGGQITPILRGISGSASNTYSPPLGQEFTVVQATGGILDSYSELVQPTDGLITGSRLDAIYRDQAIQLYVTPVSYANPDALGVSTNRNQRHAGMALDQMRPSAGLRASNDRKPLFDALAPLKANELQTALDQISGAAYAPLIWADFNNSKFLNNKLMEQIANNRQGSLSGQASMPRATGQTGTWAYALHRNSRLKEHEQGHGYDDIINGLMMGLERRLNDSSVAGIAFGYADSKADVSTGKDSARLQSWQLTAYGSHERNAWFVDGSAGVGIGQIATRRNLSLPGLNDTYRSNMRSRHLALAGRAGWSLGQAAGPRLEGWLGLQYVANQHLEASERGGQSFAQLGIDSGILQSLSPTIGLLGSIPLKTNGADWRALLKASISHELLDTRAAISTTLLGTTINVDGATAGRTSINVGLGLRGEINQRLSMLADISRQSASYWHATTANLSLRYQW